MRPTWHNLIISGGIVLLRRRRLPRQTSAVRINSETISGLGARNIGSATMSGRIAAIDAIHEESASSSMSALHPEAYGNRQMAARHINQFLTKNLRSPSAPLRSIQKIQKRFGSGPVNPGRGTRFRSATVFTSPPTAAIPGPTWG